MTVRLRLPLRLTLLTSSYTQQKAELFGRRSTHACSNLEKRTVIADDKRSTDRSVAGPTIPASSPVGRRRA